MTQFKSASLSLAALAFAAGMSTSAAVNAQAPAGGSFGLVVTNWFTAQYNTPSWEECPDGAVIGNDELWLKGISQAERIKHTKSGTIQPVDNERKRVAVLRGPNGEDVCWNPEVVKDPPLRIIKSKIGFGMNLDGSDGEATAKSCKHDNFTSPTGETGIDNQMYRIVGCILGWRVGNYMEGHPNGERRDSGKGNILIEVKNVDDMKNDADVEVAFYGTNDPFAKDSRGNLLPRSSFRVSSTPLYGSKARGRIENGVLITEPIDARLPMWGNNFTGDMAFKDMRIRFELTEDGGAKGLLAGYYDLDKWWDYIQKVEFLVVSNQFNCPAMYVASRELADGYPDPVTGKCTAISTALTMEAMPAFVIHPKGEKAPQTVSAGSLRPTANN